MLDDVLLPWNGILIKGKYDESVISNMILKLNSSSGKFKYDNVHFRDNNKIVTEMIVM